MNSKCFNIINNKIYFIQNKIICIVSLFLIVVGLCSSKPRGNGVNKISKSLVPEWSKSSVLYEVNMRQYTPEGTFKAFEKHLPRLKKLGVDILWFMPLHPISIKNRLGSLGSYYSVSDFYTINPEFGSFEDFKQLVTKCHEMGFKVFLDWVADHTGWDHPWISMHPEWYAKDSMDNIISPMPEWKDIAKLDYGNLKMREAMIETMAFWIKETDIDGYRCDVAWSVPVDFWEQARRTLNNIKPIYMLAEDEEHPDFLNEAFNSNYAWEFHGLIQKIAKGKATPSQFVTYFKKKESQYPSGAYSLKFVTNHDENSGATVYEQFGDAYKAMATISFTVPGLPLIYSGQETGMNKHLKFFEKDTIVWDGSEYEFYEKLTWLKHTNPALWNGNFGGSIHFMKSSDPRHLVGYYREKDNHQVVVVTNMSGERVEGGFSFYSDSPFFNLFTEEKIILNRDKIFRMRPWETMVIFR